MAAAKSKRRPKVKRRGRPGCLSTLFFLFVLLAAVITVIFVFFKVKTIRIEGAAHYSAAGIQAELRVSTGDNLIFINKYSVSRNVMAALPYVAEVRITRELPDTLVVEVTEYTAAAYYETSGSYWLTSSSGKLLERVNDEPKGIAKITGAQPILPVEGSIATLAGDSEVKLKTVSDTLAALERAGMTGGVSEMGIGGVYDITITYIGRFLVKLGAPEDLDYKLEYLRKIVEEELQPNEKGTIDLSRLIEDGEARFAANSGVKEE